ncbi:MAG: hypothetical protein U9N02_00620 [Campylobacterota bacterium]|nr:hypothetical protein [Campylobacterota bacterium]
MKYIIITLISILFFNGCSKNNAFDDFDLDATQELSINSLQTSKIKNGYEIDGIFSAIYLNKIYPKLFNNNEYFFVYYYMKSDIESVTLKINGSKPIKIKKLPAKNRFSNLAGIENEWNNYYLVAFKKQEKDTINLVLENGPYVSDLLVYQKE